MSTPITTELIKKLRDETSVSVMQCKKALEEAEGDFDKAVLILKKKSSEIAAKKSDRETGVGTLVMRKNDNKAVIVELNCETDFVAKNDDFVKLSNTLADMALENGKDNTMEAGKALIDEVIQKVGENIKIGSITEITGSPIGAYVHDGRIASIVTLSNGGDENLAKDFAMHITAMNPEFKEKGDIPAETLAGIRSIAEKEMSEDEAMANKPEEMKAKILEGKVEGYLKERILMEQPFFKDTSKTISQVLGTTQIDQYVRVSIG